MNVTIWFMCDSPNELYNNWALAIQIYISHERECSYLKWYTNTQLDGGSRSHDNVMWHWLFRRQAEGMIWKVLTRQHVRGIQVTESCNGIPGYSSDSMWGVPTVPLCRVTTCAVHDPLQSVPFSCCNFRLYAFAKTLQVEMLDSICSQLTYTLSLQLSILTTVCYGKTCYFTRPTDSNFSHFMERFLLTFNIKLNFKVRASCLCQTDGQMPSEEEKCQIQRQKSVGVEATFYI